MSGLSFLPEFIPKIIDGSKTQTRRLVKEGEFLIEGFEKNPNNIWVFNNNSQRIKWQVGKDYAVQSGRGKPTVLICKDCSLVSANSCLLNIHCHCEDDNWKPLRVRLTAIRRERLLDITEEEAKKEGFEAFNEKLVVETYNTAKWNFLSNFSNLNLGKKLKSMGGKATGGVGWLNKYIEDIVIETKDKKIWNPEVWVLMFEKVV